MNQKAAPHATRPNPRRRLLEAAGVLALVALYPLALAYEHALGPVPWHPSAGLVFSALLLARLRYAPALLVGAAAAGFWMPPGPAVPARLLVDAGASVVCYGLAGEALRRRVGADLSLRRPRDAGLLVLAGLGASLGVVTAETGFLGLSGSVAPGGYALDAVNTWLRDAIGVVTVAPLVLVGKTARLGTRQGATRTPSEQAIETVLHSPPVVPRGLEGLTQVASLALILWLNFGLEATADLDLFELLLLPITWMALRRGVVGGCVGVAATNFGVALTVFLLGAAPGDVSELQALMLAVSVVGLLLGASISAREHTAGALRRARDAAEAASRSKSAFLANVSHELRTPMNSILGYTDLVLDGVDGPVNPEQRSSLERVRKHARGLLRMIDDLIDFSGLEPGTGTVHAAPFEVCAVVDEVLAAFVADARAQGLAIDRSFSPAAPGTVYGDPGLLRQTLRHLVGNAIKFTETGEVWVGVSAERGERDEARLRFAVRDTGIGIPEEQRAGIFETFALADDSTTRPFGGIGLGLALARRNVRRLGGELRVESEVGRGTTFSFSIPSRAVEG
jgi:signal transduction histidine kinase